MPATAKKLTKRQLIASLLAEEGSPSGEPVYVVKTPRADSKHTGTPECICYTCQPSRNGGLSMFGLSFTDGVAVTSDKELAERIKSEYPGYTFEELA